MSNVEQNQANNPLMVPKKMSPNKEVFESVGFTFEDVGDNDCYQATLPVGWKSYSESEFGGTTLLDEKGRERGFFFYKTLPYESDNGILKLCTRFEVNWNFINPENWNGPVEVLVVDYVEDTVVFNAGQCDELESKEYNQLHEKASEFLNNNYPDWENPLKYWD